MSDQDAVLFANEAFYRAFADRDLPAMEALWSRRSPVACIHPGWNALTDRAAVMESWAGIFGSGSSPKIRCLGPAAYIAGDAAFVICYEMVDDGVLVATNIFVREDGVWTMVHHQAGQTLQEPPVTESAEEDGGTMH
ncbi:MAG: nuclear transport factor 2 family protein [Kiloniellales bacterium]